MCPLLRCRASNPFRAALLAPVLVAIAAHLAFAAATRPAATPSTTTVLHLTQSAERRLPRDRLAIKMRAEKTGSSPRTVEAAVNALMARALPLAQQARGVAVETGSYSVYRNMPARGPAQWTGTQFLTLAGTDAGSLLQTAGRLQAEGLIMSNLAYDISPAVLRGAEDRLTAEALAALQRRAAAIAQQLHLSVVGYRDLTVGNAGTEGGPRPLFAAQAATMPAPVGAAGEAAVGVTVNADILLAPKPP